jgi:hypothetical protein
MYVRKTESFIFTGTLKSLAGLTLVLGTIQFVATLAPNASTTGPLVFNTLMFMTLIPVIVTANYAGFIKLYSGKVSMGSPFDQGGVLNTVTIIALMMLSTGLLLIGGVSLFVSNHIWPGLIFVLASVLIIWTIIRKSRRLYRMIIDHSIPLIDNDAVDACDVFKASNKILLLGALAVGLGAAGIYLIGWEIQFYIGISLLIGMLILLWIFKRNINDAVQKLRLPATIELSNWFHF